VGAAIATNSSSIESTLAWLSAARYSIVLYGSLHLPAILPHSPRLYAVLRQAHTILAYLFFITFMVHVRAILFHTLIVKDSLLKRIAPWNIRPSPSPGARCGKRHSVPQRSGRRELLSAHCTTQVTLGVFLVPSGPKTMAW
jgi:hypothetical protein